jgi:hypothetical protein
MNDNDTARVVWFAYDDEDTFHYFDSQAAAIAWVEAQIPLYFDDDEEEWADDVKSLCVGCLTHEIKNFPRKDRDRCDYKLVPVESQSSD